MLLWFWLYLYKYLNRLLCIHLCESVCACVRMRRCDFASLHTFHTRSKLCSPHAYYMSALLRISLGPGTCHAYFIDPWHRVHSLLPLALSEALPFSILPAEAVSAQIAALYYCKIFSKPNVGSTRIIPVSLSGPSDGT